MAWRHGTHVAVMRLTADKESPLHTKLIATLAAAVALSGCATKPAPSEEAADPQNEGIARTCTPSKVDPAAATPATITMTNDGWCGVFVADKSRADKDGADKSGADKGGQPFSLGLVKARPAHGRVYIQPVNQKTRIEYTANTGYVGADKFTVALRSRTAGVPDATLRVDVTVTPGEGQPSAAPAASPARKPAASAHTPTRRHTVPTHERRTTPTH